MKCVRLNFWANFGASANRTHLAQNSQSGATSEARPLQRFEVIENEPQKHICRPLISYTLSLFSCFVVWTLLDNSVKDHLLLNASCFDFPANWGRK
jgi:hypothetical protein